MDKDIKSGTDRWVQVWRIRCVLTGEYGPMPSRNYVAIPAITYKHGSKAASQEYVLSKFKEHNINRFKKPLIRDIMRNYNLLMGQKQESL